MKPYQFITLVVAIVLIGIFIGTQLPTDPPPDFSHLKEQGALFMAKYRKNALKAAKSDSIIKVLKSIPPRIVLKYIVKYEKLPTLPPNEQVSMFCDTFNKGNEYKDSATVPIQGVFRANLTHLQLLECRELNEAKDDIIAQQDTSLVLRDSCIVSLLGGHEVDSVNIVEQAKTISKQDKIIKRRPKVAGVVGFIFGLLVGIVM